MKRLETLSKLANQNDKKILIWVFDGIGGLPHPDTGKTELETAKTPNLDAFAQRSELGRTLAHGHAITPGSGPGHLALFGYPNDQLTIGRGVLEVLGSSDAYTRGELIGGFALQKGDIAARGNFATLGDVEGETVITDRRGGKPATEVSRELCKKLSATVQISGVQLFVLPGKQHRFAVVFRGVGLHGGLTDCDPQVTGRPSPPCEATRPEAEKAAGVVNDFIQQATACLAKEEQANTVLLRGLAERPDIPTLPELYGLRCGAIAAYPMYRGIAKLVGFDVLGQPKDHEAEVTTLEEHFDDFDLFYLHIKETDSVAHLGDFDGKVGIFEACDALFARALELDWDAVIVTGDHCTPCILKEHSWHPIPTALWYEGNLPDDGQRLTERVCARGTLGTIPARDLVPLALAATGKLLKYGA